MPFFFSEEMVLFPLSFFSFLGTNKSLLELDQLFAIKSTVPLYCRHPQGCGYRFTQVLSTQLVIPAITITGISGSSG
ncbi:hypothetical protein PoB_000527300 [Plakobranchus ocellatus]|uniref:Uncharacterized protein n=1 Tax=Plakobranchus ocellatus TaxID=259542 RepID=A0AAV3Y8D6_9GAST|nr:hypothetical protein PoB_000527300 [Plakobranchus ocellatus]